jgi:ATP-dependent Zn protease
MTAQETEQVAYHEAGHIFCAHFFGHRITKASLNACEVELPTVDGVTPAGQTAHETIVVSLAGSYASQRFSGNGANGAGTDNAYTKYLSLRLSGGRQTEASALLDWSRCRAAGLVDRHWRAIEAVATALTQRGSLDEAEIHQIILNGDTKDGIAE